MCIRDRISAAPVAKEKSKWWLYALIAAGVLGTILIALKLRKKPVEATPAPAPQPGKPDAPAPVSYTHLDVYKRQSQG